MGLILNRKLGETVIIGDNQVRITVGGLEEHKVKLIFEADENISINREEIYLSKKRSLANEK